jgi:hypothetical protein
MKTNASMGDRYQAPELSVLEIKAEGVLCASGDKWYEQGGQGNFGYGTETDDTWA